MNKKLTLISIIALFLSVQTLSIVHASQYSFDNHDHDSKGCNVCLSAKHNKLSNNSVIEFAMPILQSFKVDASNKTSLLSGEVKIFKARDPPLFFFS